MFTSILFSTIILSNRVHIVPAIHSFTSHGTLVWPKIWIRLLETNSVSIIGCFHSREFVQELVVPPLQYREVHMIIYIYICVSLDAQTFIVRLSRECNRSPNIFNAKLQYLHIKSEVKVSLRQINNKFVSFKTQCHLKLYRSIEDILLAARQYFYITLEEK